MKKHLLFFLIFSLFSVPAMLGQPLEKSAVSDSARITKQKHLFTTGTKIKSKDFNKGVIVTPIELINGKIPGVLMMRDYGAPSSNFSVYVQGLSNLDLIHASPLYVVDGFPLQQNFWQNHPNPLNFINPKDIKNIVVLKGAAETALYGSLGASGVILITTKTGSEGRFHVEYQSQVSLSLPKLRSVMPVSEYRSIVDTKFSGQSNIISLLGDASTNWQKEIYRNVIGTSHMLSFTGGIKNLPYRLSIGYDNEGGVLKGDDFKRYTSNLDVHKSFFHRTLRIKLRLAVSRINSRPAEQSAIFDALSFNPTQPVSYFNDWRWNPIQKLNDYKNKFSEKGALANVCIAYKFTSLPGLKLVANYSFNWLDDRLYNDVNYLVGGQNPYTYSSHKYSYTCSRNNFVKAYLNYKRFFPKSNLNVNVFAGYTWLKYSSVRYYRWLNRSFDRGLWGKGIVSLEHKYWLEVSLRKDASSVAGLAYKKKVFPGVELGWDIQQEPFLTHSKIISNLKLKAAYGVSADYPESQFEGEGYPVFPGYKPGIVHSYELHLDYGFLKDRIYGTLGYYYRKISDVSYPYIFPGFAGNVTATFLNVVGNMDNHGFEMGLHLLPIATKKWQWNIGFNFTYNKTKITKENGFTYAVAPFRANVQVIPKGKAPFSFLVFEQKYENGKPVGQYVDRNGDGQINSNDRYYDGSPMPKYYGGITNHLKYKDWSLDFQGIFMFGDKVYNQVDELLGNYSAIQNYDLGNLSPDVNYTQFESQQYNSDYYVQDASFFRLSYLDISYNFKRLLHQKMNLKVDASAQNLFTLTKYKGAEPEIPGGLDYNTYPYPRIFALGVDLRL